ncbi:MAG: DUF423 domain-containing protein [Mesorhizobium sp.]|nr:DUF423 domain-containing protein [Mesorhizobium sp.]MCO5159561.1 DUF423 domain-containing protein [Mesorhizobium sp.]
MTYVTRPFLLAGGLLGAAGVSLSAAAAHAGGGNVATAANFLLVHAPAFLALGLFGSSAGRVLRAGGWIVLAGVLLFCGDLIARHYLGDRLFPMAAPTGGTLMIAGWLVIAAAAFGKRQPT